MIPDNHTNNLFVCCCFFLVNCGNPADTIGSTVVNIMGYRNPVIEGSNRDNNQLFIWTCAEWSQLSNLYEEWKWKPEVPGKWNVKLA